jgi:hypothetical protein
VAVREAEAGALNGGVREAKVAGWKPAVRSAEAGGFAAGGMWGLNPRCHICGCLLYVVWGLTEPRGDFPAVFRPP